MLAVVKALRILDAFSYQQPKLSLNELSLKTGFFKSTILRQTDTLISQGYLVRDPETGKFQLNAKLYILGQIYASTSSLLEIAPPILKDLASKTGETIAAFISDGLQRICFMISQSTQLLRTAYEPGDRLPLHAGASGKILLAFSDESFLEKVIAQSPLPVFTKNTISDPEKLRHELVRIRRKGYAVSVQEHVRGVAACAVPILRGKDELVSSLSMIGPVERCEQWELPSLVALLHEAAETISVRLGYWGDFWKEIRDAQTGSGDTWAGEE